MTISRAIIDDLYPTYLAGEASPESRELIEEYLAANPGVAVALTAAEAVRLPPVEPPPDLEARALKRTTRLLEERSLVGATAITLSYAPTVVGFLDQGGPQMLYRDVPWLAALIYLAAIGSWVRFLFVCRRVQAAGLRPRPTWTARFVWLFSGMMIGFAICAPLQYWTGWRRVYYDLPWIVGMLALGIGERLGQVSRPAEITRPITILGQNSDQGDD